MIDAAQRKLTRHRTPVQGACTRIDEPALMEPLGIESLPAVRLDLSALRDWQERVPLSSQPVSA